MTTAVAVVFALILDALFAEVRRWHPLVGFGRFALWVESALCRDDFSASLPSTQIFVGAVATVLTLFPLGFVLLLSLFLTPVWHFIFSVIILYFCLGYASLKTHTKAVNARLEADDLAGARAALAMIVSRETQALDSLQVRKALLESHLENGADAVLATIFWFVVGGAPLALLHRLVNTLDAMWGYKHERYLFFGRVAARLDDTLNFIPARLVAFSYCALGNFSQGREAWRTQAPLWSSPNAGPVMAAGAGALEIRLGGPARYHGVLVERPILGRGREPSLADVRRGMVLVDHAVVLWVILIVLLACVLAYV